MLRVSLLLLLIIIESISAQTGVTAQTGAGTGAGGGCVWTPSNDRNTQSGILQSSATTLDACKALCSASASCQILGFDFNPQNQCYFSTNYVLGTAVGVVHYNYTCSSSTGANTGPTGASTGSQVCTFILTSDQHTSGGIQQPTANTLDLCKSQCQANANCMIYGFDWNVNAMQCWFATSAVLGSSPGINHYNVSCTGTSGGNCDSVTQNTNTPGGILQPTFTTLDACKQGCLAAIASTCSKGFDFNVNAASGSNCWFSTSAVTGSATGVSHYNCVAGTGSTGIGSAATNIAGTGTGMTTGITNIGNCDTVLMNTNTQNGISQPSYKTLDSCKAACIAALATTCSKGFDFNTADNSCWFSTTATTGSATGVNHYTCTISTSTSIPTGNCDTYLNNTNTLGGIQQIYTTLDTCKAACLAALSTTCAFGFDWNPSGASGSQCWFSINANTNPGATGVFHYTCVAATTTPQANCDSKAANFNTNGGIAQPQFQTLETCKAGCLASSNCTVNGFDWDTRSSSCWFSTTSVTNPLTGVDHYTCTVVKPPQACYIPLYSSYLEPTALTKDDCYAKCMSKPTCQQYGFDWETSEVSGNQCYLSDDPSRINATIIQYADDKNCWAKNTPWYRLLGACKLAAENSNVAGSTIIPNVTTVDMCKTMCLQTATCVGFDWVVASKQCLWSITNVYAASTGTNHHNCLKGICSETKGSKLSSGVVQPTIYSFEACKYACLDSATCVNGFDWDPSQANGNQCYLSTASGALTASANVSHFVCLKATNNTCWDIYEHKNAASSNPLKGVNTLDSCRAWCRATPSCASTLGFDWNPSAPDDYKCNLATSLSLIYTPGNYHFRPKCAAKCTETIGSKATLSSLQTYKTYEECKAQCLLNPTTCTKGISFKYDQSTNPLTGIECYFNDATSTVATDASGVWVHWNCLPDAP